MGFFSSLFSGKKETTEGEQQKTKQKNFEILKYDGMRAQRMGRIDYAVKCYTEALVLEQDFETMNYLAQSYLQMHQPEEARTLLEQMHEMEPHHIDTLLALANVCFQTEDYNAMAQAAQRVIDMDKNNSIALYQLARADRGQQNALMCIAHLTQAIVLNEQFVEARLLRAEVLIEMQQTQEAQDDIDTVLAEDADNENALLLNGRVAEAQGRTDDSVACYRHLTELNPFNEQAYLQLATLYINLKKTDEAIALLDEAIELNPNFAKAYHARGRAKLINGDKDGSMEDLKKGLELAPENEKAISGDFSNQGMRKTDILGL